MQAKSHRRSVDLSAYPDLVVIYLGMKVRRLRGLPSLLRIGRGLGHLARSGPDGLLRHEMVLYGPAHIGMRQYWRDLDSLERFSRAEPHIGWWRDFMRGGGDVGFWHELYARRGGMEAIYVDLPSPIGFLSFAEARTPEGPHMTARGRLAA